MVSGRKRGRKSGSGTTQKMSSGMVVRGGIISGLKKCSCSSLKCASSSSSSSSYKRRSKKPGRPKKKSVGGRPRKNKRKYSKR